MLAKPVSIKIAATEHERRQVYRLRYKVYIAEQGKAYSNADHDKCELYDRWDDRSTNLYAEEEGQCVAAVRYTRADLGRADIYDEFGIPSIGLADIPEERLSFTSRLVSLPEQRRGLRAVKELMIGIFDYALRDGTLFNVIQTRKALVPFFERFGFVSIGELFHCPTTSSEHQTMLLIYDDLNHLQSVGSPFVSSSRIFFKQQRHDVAASVQKSVFEAFRAK